MVSTIQASEASRMHGECGRGTVVERKIPVCTNSAANPQSPLPCYWRVAGGASPRTPVHGIPSVFGKLMGGRPLGSGRVRSISRILVATLMLKPKPARPPGHTRSSNDCRTAKAWSVIGSAARGIDRCLELEEAYHSDRP